MDKFALTGISETEEAISLHERILTDIRGKILSGEWSPGFRIPFEHELTTIYSCSRMTVNKALSELAKAGLIERRRRSGSFVRAPRSHAAVLEIGDIRVEVEALGLPYAYELIKRAERDGSDDDAQRLSPDRPTLVLDLVCLHIAGHRPFCLEQRIINLNAVPEAAQESFAAQAPGPWLLSKVPWSTAEHRISAQGADTRIAENLDIDTGTPCLVVERRTWTAEIPVTNARFHYSGDNHTLVARFSPS